MRKVKMFLGLALAAAMFVSVVGCGANNATMKRIEDSGKLVLGCSADFPPYEFHDVSGGGDVIAGFDIALAREICADLGVELEITDMQFDGLIAALQSSRVDIVISGMNASEERRKAVDFTDEYYYAEQCVLVLAENKDKYPTPESFAGTKVGVQKGSLQEGFALEQLEPVGVEIFSIADVQTLVLELKSKKIEGLVLDRPIADSFLQQHKNNELAIAGCPIQGDESGFAIAVAKNNKELVEAINKTLARLKEEGKLDQYFTEAVELAEKQMQ